MEVEKHSLEFDLKYKAAYNKYMISYPNVPTNISTIREKLLNDWSNNRWEHGNPPL